MLRRFQTVAVTKSALHRIIITTTCAIRVTVLKALTPNWAAVAMAHYPARESGGTLRHMLARALVIYVRVGPAGTTGCVVTIRVKRFFMITPLIRPPWNAAFTGARIGIIEPSTGVGGLCWCQTPP